MGTFPGDDRVCWWLTTCSLSSVTWEVPHFFLLILVKEISRKLYLAYIVHVTFLLNEAALEASPAVPTPNFGAHMHLPEWYDIALLWWPKAHSLHWAHYTSWTAINTMELKVLWFGLGKKVSGLESRRLLQNSWVPSPLSTSEAHGHLMPSSGGIWHLWSLNTLTCTHTLMSIAKHLHIHTILKLIK